MSITVQPYADKPSLTPTSWLVTRVRGRHTDRLELETGHEFKTTRDVVRYVCKKFRVRESAVKVKKIELKMPAKGTEGGDEQC